MLDYQLIDADNHYYEPRDAFTRHMPAKHRHLAVHVREVNGAERIFIGDEPFTFLRHNYDFVARPGALREMLRTMKKGAVNNETTDVEEPTAPEYLSRDPRIEKMDEQGVEATPVFPTLGVCVEHSMRNRPEQLYANLEAFNRWMDDDWGYAYRNRIFASPLISLADRDRAIAELDRVLARGARIIAMLPGPAGGRSPADPYFDPFWARVNEARIVVGLHIGESGYNELYSASWGEIANPSSHRQSAFQWTCFYGDRPIMETLSAMVLHNLFGRFPNIRVASVENGSLWVPYLLAALDKMKGMGRNGPWPGGYVKGKPSEIIREHVYVAPYHEEDIPALVDLYGANRVLFGSDYPHPEGLARPADFIESVSTLSPADQRLILRDNTKELLGL